jgi:hypothetical protein
MAYDSNPSYLFPGYNTNEGADACFPTDYLPTCSGDPTNLNDIKEVLYSLLSVVAEDYEALPAYSASVETRTRATNFSITSQLSSTGGGPTVRQTFQVSFIMNSPVQDVADEAEYNPD